MNTLYLVAVSASKLLADFKRTSTSESLALEIKQSKWDDGYLGFLYGQENNNQ